MIIFNLLNCLIIVINLCVIFAQISDKRLCIDPECKEPISYAKTLIRYSSPDDRQLSFSPNVDVKIFSKSAGSNENLWGAEINGKRGYIPKNLVKETKILKKPTLLVDTEFVNLTNNETTENLVPLEQKDNVLEPDNVKEEFELIDGTKIYLNQNEAREERIAPTQTQPTVQPTVAPVTENVPKIEEIQEIKTEDGGSLMGNIVSAISDMITDGADDGHEDEEDDEDEEEDGDPYEEDEAGDSSNESEEKVVELARPVPASIQLDDNNSSVVVEEPLGAPPLVADTPASTGTPPPPITHEEPAPQVVSATELPIAEIKTELPAVEVEPVVPPAENKPELPPETTPEIPSLEPLPTVDSTPEIPSLEPLPTVDSTPEIPLEPLLPTENTDLPPPILESAPPAPSPANVGSLDDAVPLPAVVPTEEVTATVLPPVINDEVTTTFLPELEEPQPPFNEFLDEVTPDPKAAESATTPPEMADLPPPLALFNNVETNHIIEPIIDAVPPNDNDTSSETSEDINKDKNDLSFEGEVEEVLPKSDEKVDTTEGVIESPSADSNDVNEANDGGTGFFSNLFGWFGGGSTEQDGGTIQESLPTQTDEPLNNEELIKAQQSYDNKILDSQPVNTCDVNPTLAECQLEKSGGLGIEMDLAIFTSELFVYLVTTAVSVILFLLGYMALDKSKREGPLVAKINKLEKELLVVLKENQILQENGAGGAFSEDDYVPNEAMENLKSEFSDLSMVKAALEEQVQSLEKELENSTEVGLELNRMLSEILSSQNGSEVLKANVEHLQRQLVEQQSTINTVNETLALTDTENHELKLDIDLNNKKIIDLQSELDKMCLNVFKLEEEKEQQQSILEQELRSYKSNYDKIKVELEQAKGASKSEAANLKALLTETEFNLELKSKELNVLKDSVNDLKSFKHNDGDRNKLFDMSQIKAELQVLKAENQKYLQRLQQSEDFKCELEKRVKVAVEEAHQLRTQYDEADKAKVEMETKLEVLSNYFKEREAQLQKEIGKHESLWAEKQGEATSTTERIKFLQEQLQNYKTQNESLKQEIMAQEVNLKSQISVLEKKEHEHWVNDRQMERKLEDAKQEAAQLRHRLTLRERAIQEEKGQHRLLSPVEQNGELPISPLDSPASPPLLYGTRDHITKSPPIPGLPPFLPPPPPGVPFIPPPLHGVPPFIPPPHSALFPGDHRPPPLGRMSSPPINSRYSPNSRGGYSPYDRNSSSPSDSEYGTSPPRHHHHHNRGYSPYNNRDRDRDSRDDRRDYKRPPPNRSNGRKGVSSGSGNSNESLEKINRQQNKV